MRQQSIHVPLFSTKGRGKKSESKESSSERKTKIKSEGAEKGKRESMMKERKPESERSGEPILTTKAKLESFARVVGMFGVLLCTRGLKYGCCGDATVHL